MTNRELIIELRKAGNIEMPVHTADSTFHILVQKSDLISQLEDLPKNDQAGWAFYQTHADGTRRLDMA